ILNHDGAFADYVRLPALNLHVVPKNVEDDQAVFVEPLAAAFQVLKQIKLDGRKWVTVLGDGRLGLLVAQVLRNAGCPVRVIGKRCGPFREALRALSEKTVDVTSLIHRRMKLDQAVEAMSLAARPGVLKVLLTME